MECREHNSAMDYAVVYLTQRVRNIAFKLYLSKQEVLCEGNVRRGHGPHQRVDDSGVSMVRMQHQSDSSRSCRDNGENHSS